MSKLDSPQERERLATLYSGMADEELNKLLDAADELSETAREALKAEIERRGGHVEYEWEPASAEPDHPKLVPVARFRDLEQATIARGLLQSAGIDCFLADENMVRMDWFWSNMIGNMRMLVREEDAEAAMEILAQPIPQTFSTGEGGEPFDQPKCLKCGSLDIQFEGWDRGASLTAAYVLVLLPIRRDAWKCNACGAHWQEDPDQRQSRVYVRASARQAVIISHPVKGAGWAPTSRCPKRNQKTKSKRVGHASSTTPSEIVQRVLECVPRHS